MDKRRKFGKLIVPAQYGKPKQTFDIYDGNNQIGTLEKGICLDHDFLSKHHANILIEDPYHWIEDNSSTNGTYFEGRVVGLMPTRFYQLVDGANIRFGRVKAIYHIVNRRSNANLDKIESAESNNVTPKLGEFNYVSSETAKNEKSNQNSPVPNHRNDIIAPLSEDDDRFKNLLSNDNLNLNLKHEFSSPIIPLVVHNTFDPNCETSSNRAVPIVAANRMDDTCKANDNHEMREKNDSTNENIDLCLSNLNDPTISQLDVYDNVKTTVDGKTSYIKQYTYILEKTNEDMVRVKSPEKVHRQSKFPEDAATIESGGEDVQMKDFVVDKHKAGFIVTKQSSTDTNIEAELSEPSFVEIESKSKQAIGVLNDVPSSATRPISPVFPSGPPTKKFRILPSDISVDVVSNIPSSTISNTRKGRTQKVKVPKKIVEPKNFAKRESRVVQVNSRSSSLNRHSENVPNENSTFSVMFTGMDEETTQEYTRMVENLNGRIVYSWKECTHLVSDKIRRTTKFLCALSAGKNIVTAAWITASNKSKSFADCDKYIPKDSTTEKKFSFSFSKSLLNVKQRGPSKLFDGLQFFITPSVQPEFEDMDEIVTAAGGKTIDNLPYISNNNVVIISCPEDGELVKVYQGNGLKVYSNEFVLTNVLLQTIEYDKFLMPSNPGRRKRS